MLIMLFGSQDGFRSAFNQESANLFGVQNAYEKTLESIADYQENVAKQTDVEWISTVVDAQARFTRELTKLYVNTGRELLKK